MKSKLLIFLATFISISVMATDYIVKSTVAPEGIYIENGTLDNRPLYLHETEAYAIAFNSTFNYWIIGPYTEANGISTFNDYINSVNATPPTSGWAISDVKINQTITFQALPENLSYGDGNVSLVASSTSGLPVSFSSSNTSVACIIDGELQIEGPGSTVITAIQAGNDDYTSVEVSQDLVIGFDPASLNMDITNLSVNAATVSWSKIPNSSAYDIKITKVKDETVILETTTNSTSVELSSLEAATKYNVYIFPVINNEASAHDSPTEFSTLLNITNITSSSATIDWAVTSPKSRLRYSEDGTNWKYTDWVFNASSFELTGLKDNTTYYVQITTIESWNEPVVYGTQTSFKTNAIILSVTNITSQTVTCRWSEASPINRIRYSENGVNWKYSSWVYYKKSIELTGLKDNTTYIVQLAAINNWDEPAVYNILSSFKTSAITLSASNISHQSAKCEWSEASPINRIRYSEDGVNWKYSSWVYYKKSIELTGLKDNTTYYIQLAAINNWDEPALYDIQANFKTSEITLSASNVSHQSVKCEWSDASPINRIRYSEDGVNWKYSSWVFYKTSCELTGLKDNTTYYIQLAAINNWDEPALYDIQASFKTSEISLSVSNETSLSAICTWSGASPINRIRYSDDGVNWQYTGWLFYKTSYKLSGLKDNTSYTVQLVAMNNWDDPAEYDIQSSFTTSAISLSVSNEVSHTATCTWTDPSPINRVRYSEDGVNWVYSSWLYYEKSYELTGLKDNTTYTVQLVAMNNWGEPVLYDTETVFTYDGVNEKSFVENTPQEEAFDPEQNFEFYTYPNPVGNELNIKTNTALGETVQVLVTELSGRVLLTSLEKTYAEETVMIVDLSNLPSGLYIVKVVTDSQELTKNIIKK